MHSPPSLTLTCRFLLWEWEEWGNPIEDKEVYEYMKSYTPYENIRPVRYPAIAAVTSLHDTRVFYVEPAKWIAKLRETTTHHPHPAVEDRYDWRTWRRFRAVYPLA